MDDPRLGTRLNRTWRLEAVLGRGATSTVYRTRNRAGELRAVKLLHRHLVGESEIVRRFFREATLGRSLDHPVAVPVLAQGRSQRGEPFLVLPLLSGQSLESHVASNGARSRHALIVADRILDLLAHAHPRGILHRDLKPDNVFIESNGSVRVLDFGVAQYHRASFTSLTGVGTILGTPGYMPPEQAQIGGRAEVRSDLWAVGAILFFMLTGRPVRFHENDAVELLLAATTPAPRLGSSVGTADPELCELVDRALAFEAEGRFADADAMRAAVRTAYRSLHGGSVPDRVLERRRHERLPSAFPLGIHARRGARVGVCRSYGRTGLLVATPSRFASGEPVELEFPRSCTGLSPFRARGQIMHSRFDGSGPLCQLAAIRLDRPLPTLTHERLVDRVASRA